MGPCMPGQVRPGPDGQAIRRLRLNLCTGRRCTVDEPTRTGHSCGDASRGSVQDSSSCVLDTNHSRYHVLSVCRSSDYMECTCVQKDSPITETESRQWWWKCHCKLESSRTVLTFQGNSMLLAGRLKLVTWKRLMWPGRCQETLLNP